MTKNILIIGGNSDIGLEINNLAKAEGHSVYGTSRDEAISSNYDTVSYTHLTLPTKRIV